VSAMLWMTSRSECVDRVEGQSRQHLLLASSRLVSDGRIQFVCGGMLVANRIVFLVASFASLGGCSLPSNREAGHSALAEIAPQLTLLLAKTVERIEFEQRTFYVLRANQCCDLYDFMYDDSGKYVCAPRGGIGGGGDRMCPAWVYRNRLCGQEVRNPFIQAYRPPVATPAQ
jgi:hypothetical protein